MRITNNLSLNFQIDRTALIDSKGNNQAAGKLMELLQASPNRQLSTQAVLQSVSEGLGKFWISGVGTLEVNVTGAAKLTEQAKVPITFTLADGQIFAELTNAETQTEQAPETVKSPEALLKQLGLQKTPQNEKAVQLLNEYRIEPSAERIKQLAEGSFLASKINDFAKQDEFIKTLLSEDQQVDWSKSLKAMVVDWLGQKSGQKAPETPGNQQTAIKQQPQPDVEAVAAEAFTASEILEGMTDEGEQAKPTVKPNEQPKATGAEQVKVLLQNLSPKALLPLVATSLALTLENLNRSDQVFGGGKNIGHLKQALIQRISDVFSKLEPSEALKMDIAEWLETDSAEFLLGKQLDTLEQIIAKHSPEAAKELKENFEQINRAAAMVDQLSSQMMAFHLPIKLGEFDTQIELYMNKRRSKNSQEDFKMLLALGTESLGQVQVLLTDQKNQVDIQFRLEDEAIRQMFMQEEETLQEMTDGIAGKKVKLSFGCHFKEPAVLEAFKELSIDSAASIDVRV